ncbi:hypothetical protein WT27_15895 [Burkholderia territorii]|uniref:Uncharacterized protein n=1 Tax=Burkholderia territorii TaxID=1503055 RepID=A0A105V020_9BURK|nr:hypothetical protein WT27_15895 [Burkholderia territorii]
MGAPARLDFICTGICRQSDRFILETAKKTMPTAVRTARSDSTNDATCSAVRRRQPNIRLPEFTSEIGQEVTYPVIRGCVNDDICLGHQLSEDRIFRNAIVARE